MKKSIIVFLLFFAGILIGGFWTNFKINQLGKDSDLILKNGVWRYFTSMDLATNELQKAYIGKIGLLALQDSEVIYFIASTDEEGNPLSSSNDYKLTGSSFDTRYWSYTLYGEDHFLIPNDKGVFSFNMENIVYKDSLKNSYELIVSRDPKKENWLPAGEANNMSILLRLYNSAENVYKNKDAIELPTLKKINQ